VNRNHCLWLFAGVAALAVFVPSRPAAQAPAIGAPANRAEQRADLYRDPLPPGVRARLGTLRWRHDAAVSFVAYLPYGKTLATISANGMVRQWDSATGKQSRAFSVTKATTVALSADGKTLAAAGDDATVRLWDMASGKEIRAFAGHGGSVFAVALSSDGKTLASAISGGFDHTKTKVRLWDVASGKELHTFARLACSLAFAPDKKTLASAERLWDVASGKEIHDFDPQYAMHGDPGKAVVFFPDGKTLASAWDSTVRLWDLATGKQIRTFAGHRAEVCSLAFSPDGKTLASGTNHVSDPTLRIWDVASGKEVRAFSAHGNALAYAPDGKTLASASYEQTLRLWDLIAGKEIDAMAGHRDEVMSVAYAPDGKTLASGSRDGTLWLWDVASGKHQVAVAGHQAGVMSLAYAPDGKTGLGRLPEREALGSQQWKAPPHLRPQLVGEIAHLRAGRQDAGFREPRRDHRTLERDQRRAHPRDRDAQPE
jgi:WD40 repeat protein